MKVSHTKQQGFEQPDLEESIPDVWGPFQPKPFIWFFSQGKRSWKEKLQTLLQDVEQHRWL